MLEIRDLTKIYRPKKGVPVTALDHVSLRLPARGMVFLLGRSGSGKSTLLNLLGGLDKYDEGEILIKGASSQGFRQQHFDSYRNTYVGFIFQEYNILDEFTVGANIALAIELQGKKATDQQINEILRQVDLDGYGARRPNELSGGQKQRVAIARALVKQPRIIMADEPTGALDSNTGRQIFDTLKKLSADRLVIVVSHDREFAEQYADRIIELADGRVISDLTYTDSDTDEPVAPLTYAGGTVDIAAGYHLTEEDREAINAYIDSLQTSVTLRLKGKSGSKRSAVTDNAAIPMESDGFTLIKSRLPLRSAFKIGASGLKHKRFRLVVTILLSCIAFGLFGLADTFGAYDHIRACTDSLIDSHVDYASVQKAVRMEDSNYYRSGYTISDEDIAAIQQQTGVQMQGIYTPHNWGLDFEDLLNEEELMEAEDRVLYSTGFNGLTEITADRLADLGYELIAGKLPDGSREEIAISAYTADTFVRYGYIDAAGKAIKLKSRADMVGKKLPLHDRTYTITGIIDTAFDIARYEVLADEPDNMTTAEQLVRFALQQEMRYAQDYSLHRVAFVGDGYVDHLISNSHTLRPLRFSYLYFIAADGSIGIDPYQIGRLEDVKDAPYVWLDGKPRTELGEKELVITLDLLGYPMDGQSLDSSDALTQQIGDTIAAMGTLEENSSRLQQADGAYKAEPGYTVVGYIDPQKAPDVYQTVLTGDTLYNALVGDYTGWYDLAVGPMPTDAAAVERLVSTCYREADTRLELKNAVTYELDTIHEALVMLSKVFLYIGIGFALFAALMLTNFISTSIAHKKQEIGILRAIGSRSNDVFRIFFSESFLIAMINFLLATIGVGTATAILNSVIRTELNVLITVLHFGLRQIVLLLVVSLLVAAVASFFPVRHIAAKRPIDAIRDR